MREIKKNNLSISQLSLVLRLSLKQFSFVHRPSDTGVVFVDRSHLRFVFSTTLLVCLVRGM
jgi:hypothetical protein